LPDNEYITNIINIALHVSLFTCDNEYITKVINLALHVSLFNCVLGMINHYYLVFLFIICDSHVWYEVYDGILYFVIA